MAHLDLRSKIPEKWSEWLDNIILDEIECVVADIAGVVLGIVLALLYRRLRKHRV